MHRIVAGFVVVLCLSLDHSIALAAEGQDIKGTWRAQTYQMKDGTRHDVDGLISFSETDWSVIFFIVEEGTPTRGSAEGGTYSLTGSHLVFRHLYHLAAGQPVPGVPGPPKELTMTVRKPDARNIPSEACNVENSDGQLTINFPSGNVMVFLRSSSP